MLPDTTTIHSAMKRAGVDGASAEELASLGMLLRIPAASLKDAMVALRDEEEFAQLLDMFGNDTGEALEVTYHLRSFSKDQDLYVRIGVDYDGDLPSIFDVYPSAIYVEREAAEMYGMNLVGHPNPKRLLTVDEPGVFLLRKSTPIRTEEEVHERAW